MRAISLWQPFASLIFAGRKKYETRHWAFPEVMKGETIAIHAAKKPIPRDRYGYWVNQICANAFKEHHPQLTLDLAPFGLEPHPTIIDWDKSWPTVIPYGALLGTVRLVECHRVEDVLIGGERVHMVEHAVGNWDAGRFAWELGDITPYETPIPAKGRQGWWEV